MLEPQAYGEAIADVYDDWYGDISDVEGTVATIARLARGGRVLELGIGTGRLAVPLRNAGVDVWGIDASPAMVERVRAKPGGGDIPVVIGDFSAQSEQPIMKHLVIEVIPSGLTRTTTCAGRAPHDNVPP